MTLARVQRITERLSNDGDDGVRDDGGDGVHGKDDGTGHDDGGDVRGGDDAHVRQLPPEQAEEQRLGHGEEPGRREEELRKDCRTFCKVEREN